MLIQNEFTCHFALDRVNPENSKWRLNDRTASIGFIYRHVGETMHLFTQFLGVPTEVKNTTIGQVDQGQDYDVESSRELIQKGYKILSSLAESGSAEFWQGPIETPFFGSVPRIRLFAHILFHNSHHAGQISLTLAKGNESSKKVVF